MGLSLFVPLLAATGCVARQTGPDLELTAQLDQILTRLDATGAVVTARVLELPGGRELYARDCDVPYTPASNMKIPVSAAGLDIFGSEHTFKTYLAQDGDDLWVIGTGDPGIGDPRLAKRRDRTAVSVFDDWADAMERRGLTQIAGDLYYYDGALDTEWLHASWGEDVLHWYGAPTGGLNFNNNCVDITIHPTTEGQLVRYEVMPPVKHITVINDCVTGPKHAPTIEKLPDGDVYRIGGTCAERAELKSKPVTDPGAFFCDALRTHLAARGIEIAGQTKRIASLLDGVIPPPSAKVIAFYETSVRDVIDRINTNSQNFFAEALSKLAGKEHLARQGRHGPGSWAGGEQAIRAFLQENDIDDDPFAMADGSGLSDDNKVTSRMITDIFAVMHSHPEAETYRYSLAKGGIDGTLKERFAGYDGRVFAKTGYIEGVRALSGYVKTNDGRWLTFSIIYNKIPGTVKPYEALQDEAVRLLVEWPLIEAPPAKRTQRKVAA